MLTATAAADAPVSPGPDGAWSRLVGRATTGVPAASTAVARIVFGLLVTYSSVRFWRKGWVESLYLAPEHHLTYRGFEWVRPLPAGWMQAAVLAMAVCGLAVAVGYRTRLAALTFAALFTCCELIDAALYLNHYVYMTMAALLMAALPVGSMWSLDARAGRVARSTIVPAAVVWLLRFQLAVVYLFAGIAKLNPDWLFDAMPLRIWLADRTHLPLVGPLLDEPAVAYLASWTGAAFDLSIVWLLLWRRSRPWAYITVVAFHLSTTIFRIGVFPWVMIVSTWIFFDPAWPAQLGRRLARSARRCAPIVQLLARSPSFREHTPTVGEKSRSRPESWRRLVTAAVVGWVCLQVAIPGRHFVIPGNARWTEEGYYGSYRVMLNEKAGWYMFVVTDSATGVTWRVDPDIVLTSWQETQAAARPDLLLASAHLAADYYRDRGSDVEVRADSWVSVNGRQRQRMIDPAVDLAGVSRWAPASSYMLPFDPPTRE